MLIDTVYEIAKFYYACLYQNNRKFCSEEFDNNEDSVLGKAPT